MRSFLIFFLWFSTAHADGPVCQIWSQQTQLKDVPHFSQVKKAYHVLKSAPELLGKSTVWIETRIQDVESAQKALGTALTLSAEKISPEVMAQVESQKVGNALKAIRGAINLMIQTVELDMAVVLMGLRQYERDLKEVAQLSHAFDDPEFTKEVAQATGELMGKLIKRLALAEQTIERSRDVLGSDEVWARAVVHRLSVIKAHLRGAVNLTPISSRAFAAHYSKLSLSAEFKSEN